MLTAIVVAAVSLGYDYLKRESVGVEDPPEARRQVVDPTPPRPESVAGTDAP